MSAPAHQWWFMYVLKYSFGGQSQGSVLKWKPFNSSMQNTPTDALLLTENKICNWSRLFCMPYLSGILFVSDLRFKHDKTIYGYLIKRGALIFFLLHIDPTLLMCKGLRLQKDLSVKPWTLILDSMFSVYIMIFCILYAFKKDMNHLE